MKKKSKILNKLITALLVVFCFALLCVPAFASSDSLVEIFPETTFSVGSDGSAKLSDFPLLSVGSTYVVNWNGFKYTCVALDVSSVIPGAVAMGNGEVYGFPGNGEPFIFISVPGQGTAALALDGSLSFSVSIFLSVPIDTSNLIFIQVPVVIPESGQYEGFWSVPLIEGKTYFVLLDGIEYECVAEHYSGLDGNMMVLDGGSSFFYIQSNETHACLIDAPAGFEFAVYQRVDHNAAFFDDLNVFVSSSVGWVGQFVNTVVAQPLLLCFCVVIFVGLGIGLISRIKK